MFETWDTKSVIGLIGLIILLSISRIYLIQRRNQRSDANEDEQTEYENTWK